MGIFFLPDVGGSACVTAYVTFGIAFVGIRMFLLFAYMGASPTGAFFVVSVRNADIIAIFVSYSGIFLFVLEFAVCTLQHV